MQGPPGVIRIEGQQRKALAAPARHSCLEIVRKRTGHTLEFLAERMVLALVNESARCLEDGVVAEAGALDLAMIFGTGFPPFRGGPLRYADTYGLERIASKLSALAAEKGERFTPSPRLVELARAGGSFTQPITV